MKVQFRKIANADGPLKLRQSVDVSGAVLGRKDIAAVSPLDADLKALPAGTDCVTVEGTLTGDADMLCARCLQPVKVHHEISFAETFKWMKQPVSPEDDDEEVVFVQDETLDLIPYVEESYVLHMPVAALCSEDCRGLCQKCGQNLNEGACACDNRTIDPRLAGLKDFFK